MKSSNIPAFRLRNASLAGYTSEAILRRQGGERSNKPHLGIQSPIFEDSGCYYAQLYSDAGKLDGYLYLRGFEPRNVIPVRQGRVGPAIEEPALFALSTMSPGGGTDVKFGSWDSIAAAICSPSFAATEAALQDRPRELFLLASFMALDVVKFAGHRQPGEPCQFDVSANLATIARMSAVRDDILISHPEFGTPGGQDRRPPSPGEGDLSLGDN